MRNSDNFKDLSSKGAALITGASRGLGLALSYEFAAHGFDTVLCGRNAEKLEKHAADLQKYGVKTYVYTADLSAPEEAERLYGRIKKDGVNLSVLVNNAGIGASGKGWEVPAEKDRELTGLNVNSAVTLTKLFLSDACKRGYGAVMNVCSVGAFQPGPYTASYYASKAFLYSYTLALREEAKEYGVTLSTLCPGPVDTEFFISAGANKPKCAISAEKAAAYAYKKFAKGRKTIIPGILNRIARRMPQSLKIKYIARIKKR